LQNGAIYPKSCFEIQVIFKPTGRLFQRNFSAVAFLSNPTSQSRQALHLSGQAETGKIEFNVSAVNLGSLFLHQKHCFELVCRNIGLIPAKVLFAENISCFGGEIEVIPDCLNLACNQCASFVITYVGRKKGKFMEKIGFREEYGEQHQVVVSGEIRPVILPTTPQFLDFGNVPVCVQQTRYIYLKNPLPTALYIYATIGQCGEEEPLVFEELYTPSEPSSFQFTEIKNVQSTILLPISSCDDILFRTKEKIESIQSKESLISKTSEFSVKSSKTVADETIEIILNLLNQTFESHLVAEETLVELERQVDNHMIGKDAAEAALENAFFEAEAGAKIALEAVTGEFDWYLQQKGLAAMLDKLVDEVLDRKEIIDHLLDVILTEIFEAARLPAYFQKDWTLSKYPKEFSISPKTCKIDSNQCGIICIDLFPNIVGVAKKTVTIYNSYEPFSENLDNDLKEFSVQTITVAHHCFVPDLRLEEATITVEGYIDLAQTVHIQINNLSSTDGFGCFSPKNVMDLVQIGTEEIKFRVPAYGHCMLEIEVLPQKVGSFVQNASLAILGSDKPLQLGIKLEIQPPEIAVLPTKISEHVSIFSANRSRVFIENISPTRAKFKVGLELVEYSDMEVCPLGGILAAAQGSLILIDTKFLDPGEYRNTLKIDVENGALHVSIKALYPLICSIHIFFLRQYP
jgi:hypothetical protein